MCLTNALEAEIGLSPDWVGAVSTMTLTVMFDESLSRSGVVKVEVVDKEGLDSSNAPLSFNAQSQISCTASVSLESCITSNSKEIYLKLGARHILAGDSVTFTLTNACKNPSSLYFKNQSLKISTLNQYGAQIESRDTNLFLQSLTPAPIVSHSIDFGS